MSVYKITIQKEGKDEPYQVSYTDSCGEEILDAFLACGIHLFETPEEVTEFQLTLGNTP